MYMRNWLIMSVSIYLFAIGVYAFWSYLAFVNLDKIEWTGSLVFLPHGVRVIGICYFGYKSIPALYVAEITGPILVYPQYYFDVWPAASIASMLSVVMACELVKWSGRNVKENIISPKNFSNYRSIALVVVLSALFNSIGSNVVTSLLANVVIDGFVVMRFFIGDVLGAVVLILFLSAVFTALKQNKLLLNNKD
jgi:small basic protein